MLKNAAFRHWRESVNSFSYFSSSSYISSTPASPVRLLWSLATRFFISFFRFAKDLSFPIFLLVLCWSSLARCPAAVLSLHCEIRVWTRGACFYFYLQKAYYYFFPSLFFFFLALTHCCRRSSWFGAPLYPLPTTPRSALASSWAARFQHQEGGGDGRGNVLANQPATSVTPPKHGPRLLHRTRVCYKHHHYYY